MAVYRCYLLDDQNHIVAPGEVLNAPDDETAKAQAKTMCERSKSCASIELYCGDRLVARMEPS
jgi:hypothetical protein